MFGTPTVLAQRAVRHLSVALLIALFLGMALLPQPAEAHGAIQHSLLTDNSVRLAVPLVRLTGDIELHGVYGHQLPLVRVTG